VNGAKVLEEGSEKQREKLRRMSTTTTYSAASSNTLSSSSRSSVRSNSSGSIVPVKMSPKNSDMDSIKSGFGNNSADNSSIMPQIPVFVPGVNCADARCYLEKLAPNGGGGDDFWFSPLGAQSEERVRKENVQLQMVAQRGSGELVDENENSGEDGKSNADEDDDDDIEEPSQKSRKSRSSSSSNICNIFRRTVKRGSSARQ
jgi:hypothetical protein